MKMFDKFILRLIIFSAIINTVLDLILIHMKG